MKKHQFIAIILLLILVPTSVFAAESLEITTWVSNSQLLENGNLEISEDLTFRFNDDFNGVYRNIVKSGTDGISNLLLFEVINGEEIPYANDQNADIGDKNVYSIEDNSNEVEIMIFSPSEDQEKTFRIKYTILNVAKLHEDTGEFYYKYLGEGNDTPINYFLANLSLASTDMENVRIFAHGPLNGSINFVDKSSIKLEVSNVPTNTFIEARVLYPKEFTPLSTKTGDSNLNSILDEEQSFMNEVKEKAESRKRNKEIFDKLSIVSLALGAVVAAWFFKLNKRDPSVYMHKSNLYPDDISPAELNLFMDSTISSRGLMASIFDLARREHLTIDEMVKDSSIYSKKELKKQDFEFIRSNKTNTSLLDHERYLLDWLFNTIGHRSKVTTIDIDHSRSKDMINFNKSQSQWFKLVKEELKTRGYNDQRHKGIATAMILISIPILILGIAGMAFGSISSITMLAISVLTFVLGIILIVRKTDEGYEQYQLWKDFKKEFENYKDLDIGIPKDKTLIYAVALGLSLKKLEDQRRYYGNDYYPSYWGIWYFSSLNKKGGSAFEDSFNNSFYGYTDSSSPNATSFGGGGGFSGGGGGGAGGGGAGGF